LQFESILRELVSHVEGAQGAILVEGDGEAVQWHSEGDAELLRLRAAYLSVLVRATRAGLSRLGLGNRVRLTIEYEGAWFLTEDLEHGYFVVLELCPLSNLGQAMNRIVASAACLRSEITA
jgi:predicted regulator of Ras-like GTPase activity (Roadblock/LC7/MglB family)